MRISDFQTPCSSNNYFFFFFWKLLEKNTECWIIEK